MAKGNKTDNGVHEVGTEETRLAYQNDTPGQQVEEYLSQIALQNEEKKSERKKNFSQVFDNPLKGFPYNEAFEVTDLGEDYKKVIKMYPSDKDWKKLITKHRKAIDDFRKNNKDLPSKVEDELLGWASQTGEVSGKHDAEDFIISILDESTISENYRELAKHGMGAETKNSIKVGTEVDYYQKDGAKYMGKITKMSRQSYTVRDDKTKKDHEFFYHDRIKAAKLLKQGDNLGEGTFSVKLNKPYKRGDEEMYMDIIKKYGGKNLKFSPPKGRDLELDITFDGGDVKKIKSNLPNKGKGSEWISENADMVLHVDDKLQTNLVVKMANKFGLKSKKTKISWSGKDGVVVSGDSDKLKKFMSSVEDVFKEETISEDDPCWKDYKQVGMKKKNGKEVPNCVPKEEIEDESIDEKVDPKILKAIEVAMKMGGNMTGAVKAIEKIKKGLSKHKDVSNALRYANEEVNMSPIKVVFNEGMSKLLSPAQQAGVLKKWNEPEDSTFAKEVYSNAKIANKKDFIVTSHPVKDGDYYLSLLGNKKEGELDNELVKANTNMNADIRKICAKWSKSKDRGYNPAGMAYLEIEKELCDKKYNNFAAADTMVRDVVWGMVEDLMKMKIISEGTQKEDTVITEMSAKSFNQKAKTKPVRKLPKVKVEEGVMDAEPLKDKYPFQKKFSVEQSFREMFEEELKEETIVYRVKGIQKPETDKFNQSAKMMKLKISFKKQGSDTHVTMTGNKKQLRDFDSVARGKSSYGDPSSVQHFDEK